MVCEVDETLKGPTLGYLGDVGHASLGLEQINNLLDLVACEKNITYLFRDNSGAKSSSTPLKSAHEAEI